jgi:glutathione peroxidase
MTTLHDFTATALDGTERSLADFAGSVVLVVNTASRCGFTPQYEGLERLYRQFSPEGFAVLGFPCNQFAGQEPGTASEIAEFCSSAYDVTFPMFARIDVNGGRAHPLYRWLKSERRSLTGGRISWNFTKFLVGRDGAVIARYGSATTPESLRDDIRAALAAQPK